MRPPPTVKRGRNPDRAGPAGGDGRGDDRCRQGGTIAFLWKRKGGKKGDKGIWGKVSPVSGVAQYWGGVEYVVWLAADHCRKNRLGARQIEALLYHEFCHFGQDPDTGEIKMVGHDAEVFAQEVREYGLWTVDLEPVADAFRQLPLTPFEE
jgi:hypothetical protein